MSKTGWQVLTAVFLGLSAMLGAVAYNNSRALEVANAQLRDRPEPVTPECPSAPTPNLQPDVGFDTIMRAENAKLRKAVPDLAKCIGGQAFVKLDGEWTNNGPC